MTDEFKCVSKLKGLIVPASPDKMKLFPPANINPKSTREILRARFSCVGHESLVPPGTWASLFISALNCVLAHSSSSPPSQKDSPNELIIFAHDLHMFGDLDDSNEPLRASVSQFCHHIEKTLTRMNLVVRIVCVRLSSRRDQYTSFTQTFRHINMLLRPLYGRVSLECIDNNCIYIDYEFKSLLMRTIPSQRSELSLPTVDCSKASIMLTLKGCSLESYENIQEGMARLEVVCTVPRSGVDACCVHGSSVLACCCMDNQSYSRYLQSHLTITKSIHNVLIHIYVLCNRMMDNLHMFESLVATLIGQDSLLLLRAWKPTTLHKKQLLGSHHSSQQQGRDGSGVDASGGHWQYWALIPPARTVSADVLSSGDTASGLGGECAVLIRLCDEESFLVDANQQTTSDTNIRVAGGADSVATAQSALDEEETRQEYASYMKQCVQQMGHMDTYNPLAFPSGRYSRPEVFEIMDASGTPATATTKSTATPTAAVTVQDPHGGGGQQQQGHPYRHDGRQQSLGGKRGGGPRSTGALPITTTSTSTGTKQPSPSFVSAQHRAAGHGNRSDGLHNGSSGSGRHVSGSSGGEGHRDRQAQPAPPSKTQPSSQKPFPYENYQQGKALSSATSATTTAAAHTLSSSRTGAGRKRPIEQLSGAMEAEGGVEADRARGHRLSKRSATTVQSTRIFSTRMQRDSITVNLMGDDNSCDDASPSEFAYAVEDIEEDD
jgi:hypothetical protein